MKRLDSACPELDEELSVNGDGGFISPTGWRIKNIRIIEP